MAPNSQDNTKSSFDMSNQITPHSRSASLHARLRSTSLLVVSASALLAAASAQSTTRVSESASGTQGNFQSLDAAISADGRFIAFHSSSSNLVAGDTNANTDIFVRDRVSGSVERVSLSTGGLQGNGWCIDTAISADGRFVAFKSSSTNFVPGDTNGAEDIFVRDRQLGTTECASVSSGGTLADGYSVETSISGDGRYVAFTSVATNLVAGDTNGKSDIFVHDRSTGATVRASVSTSGVQGAENSSNPSISGDGRFVTFQSYSSNLAAPDPNGTVQDIFVRDLLLGTTEILSVGSSGGGGGIYPSISADGRFVAFQSNSGDLVAGDTNFGTDVFVRDRQLGTIERANLTASGGQASNGGDEATISYDGRYVTFASWTADLVAGDTNGWKDIFVRDRVNSTTVIASIPAGGGTANNSSNFPSISADGRFVVFESGATNLVAGDTNSWGDVFLRDVTGPPPPLAYCFGDGSSGPCPCGNNGASGRGCENSASTGGAQLSGQGSVSLANDTLVLTSTGELPSALSILLQGSASIGAAPFGDGLRCAGGVLKRLFTRNASGGTLSLPQVGDPAISARSAALGDTLSAGAARAYQTYYRDPQPGFCPTPQGNSWNISSGVLVVWAQ
ncbi:MAG: PD40 domain-containing protein [Planctomycetes bacterium]|nr:PD40 domain-containing protein [Planctomycetota bacterium]